MLKFTRQESILIAVTLGIMLSVPVLVPVFYGSSTITLRDRAGDRLEYLPERSDVGGDAGEARTAEPGLDCGLSPGSQFNFRSSAVMRPSKCVIAP